MGFVQWQIPESVHEIRFFVLHGDSHLVDLETKIAAEWKRTFSLPLRLSTIGKDGEMERKKERLERIREERVH